MEAVNNHLVEEIHHKKANLRRTKFHISESITEAYYKRYLFKSRKSITSLDPHPSHYQSILENVLLEELKQTLPNAKDNFDYMSVYYSHNCKPETLKFNNFDSNQWTLSQGPQMTLEDIAVMVKYKQGFIAHLDKLLLIIKNSKWVRYEGTGEKIQKLQKERDRVFEVMNV